MGIINWLRNLAGQLFTPPNPSVSGREQETRVLFLMQLLQATADSAGNPEVIYPILKQNLDKVNDNLAQILREWATDTLAQLDGQSARNKAADIVNFSSLMQQFPLGSIASNMEIAIAGYEVAQRVFTREAFPLGWAATQINLGLAYRNRIRGDRAENLERAIEACEAALQVFTRSAFPQEWAGTQNNLGAAYWSRIRGDRADNLERSIGACEAALQVFTRSAFPQYWAMMQNHLGAAYWSRIRGDRADNLERSIGACEAALQVFTRSAFPQYWAMTQNHLGAAYSDRIRGDRAENLETAIAAFQAALQVYTREAFPQNWAMTQNNLGNAYSNRIKGDRAENLETAIGAYQLALQVYTPEAFPQDWAMTQNNLGNAYGDRIRGDRAENLETAIAAYQAALQVRTREAFPQDWAATQYNLGLPYWNRIRGDRAENLERAIAAYQAALQVYTRKAFPQDWAATQNNLGVAYSDRIRGDRAKNLERAIAAFQAALQVRTRKAFPQNWAATQNNLGLAYGDRTRGDGAENLERAIAAYEAALEVYTRKAFPQNWAATQNNLGLAYSNRITGDRAENLETAIAAYQAALQVYPREAFPQNWATTQNNLGLAYSNRITGDRAENLERAIGAFEAALEVITPTADPIECLETGRNLGNLAFAESRWELAMRGYDAAIKAVEQSREWVTSPRRKREILEAALDVYENMVRACISAKQWERALETVERSKSRQLVELLANAYLYPKGAPEKLKQELNQLRRHISAAQQFLAEAEEKHLVETRFIASGAGDEKTADTSGNLSKKYIKQQQQQQRQILEESQPQLDKLLNQIKEFDPQFTLTQRVEPITFEEIHRLIDSETAILEWHIGTEGFQTFIIIGNTLEVVQFAGDELQQLKAWAVEYLGDYGETTWGYALAERLNTLSQILRLPEIIAKIPPTCRRLILIPHRYLHLFPLHALPVSPTCRGKTQPAMGASHLGEQGYCLLDEFPAGVCYAPSCQLLQLVRNRKRSAGVPRFLFAIQNPTKDLSYADIEVEVIKRDFDPHTRILPREQATKTALLQNQDILRRTGTAHFSCHGRFELEFPLSSSLILADSLESSSPSPQPPTPSPKKGEREEAEEGDKRYLTLRDGRKANPERCLTLQDIFASLELPQCQLVTLSACETGLTGAAQLIDEYIGLPSGFLYAGSLSVVSSLWRVDDFATAVLMIKFYQCLRGGDSGESGVPVALNTAQTWLRNVTKEDFLNWVTGLGLPKRYNEEAQLWVDCSPDDKPFHKPQYWAAFGAIGQ